MKFVTVLSVVILLWAAFFFSLNYGNIPGIGTGKKTVDGGNCTLTKAYWNTEGQKANLVLESENCTGRTAVFSVYEKDIQKKFIENVSAAIYSDKMTVPWNAQETFATVKPDAEYTFEVFVNPSLSSDNALVFTGDNFVTQDVGAEEKGETKGWVSWAKDSHNSRIADDAVVPPFTLKWTARYPNSDKNLALHLTRLLYQDGRLFVVMARHQMSNQGAGVAAYNATNGALLWKRTIGGVKGNIGLFVLSSGYVWGGLDHGGDFSANMETGESGGGGARDSYANTDESGVYSNGIPCTDCTTIKLEPLIPIFKPRYNITNYSMFGNAVKFPPYPGYKFDSRDYLNVGNNLNPGSSNWTAMLWFKWDGSAGDGTLFVKGETSDYYNTIYRAGINGGKIYYTLKSDEPYSYGKQYGLDSFNCSKDEWCHFALTYDHQYQRMYKNGQLVFEQNRTGDIGSNNRSVYIGGFREISSFGGVIDEFAMFNRALSSEEIASKYDKEIVPDSSTQLLLHFNNDSAFGENEEYFYDYSGKGNHAVYNGHINFYNPWSYSISNTYTGVQVSWYGGDGGMGQPALHDGILYLPDGILWARNTSTGKVIWQNGTWPFRAWPNGTKAPEEMLDAGDVAHFSEVTYSNGKVYVFGRECFAITNRITTTSAGFSTITVNKTTCDEWDVPCLYSYDALTGKRLGKVCLEANYAPIDVFTYASADGKFPGRGFETIIDGNVAYVSTVSQILALNLLTGEKIWEYKRPIRLDYRGDYDIQDDPFDIGDIVLSGNLLYGLEQFEDCVIAFDKNTGEKVWTFKPDDSTNMLSFMYSPSTTHRLTGLAIVDSVLFVSGERGMIYALEQAYSMPKITNNEDALARGEVGKPSLNYSFGVLNGKWPFNWKVVSGRIPDGLSLKNDKDNYNGIISGTPTESGDFTFTIKVTDARGNSDEKTFSLRIVPDSKVFSITLQDNENYSVCEDAYIYGYSSNANKNFGNQSLVSVSEGYKQRGLVKFKTFQKDGGPVPDDAILTGATLTLYKTDAYKHVLNAYKILANWSEMQVTWNQARSGGNWSSAGANETEIDRTEILVNFTTSYAACGMGGCTERYTPGSYTFDVTPLVQGYDLGEENTGWLFTQSTTSSAFSFYSSDYFNTSEADNGISKRPKLTLTYKRFNPENKAPVAKIYANPSIVLSGQNVTLDASQSYDPDGYVAIYEFPTASCLPGFGNGLCKTSFFSPAHFMCRCCPNGGWACINYTEWCSKSYNEFCPYKKYISTMSVTVYDDYGINASSSVNVTILQSFNQTTITTTMLRDGRKNSAYLDYVYVEGNKSKVTWGIARGSLPSGLSLDSSTGKISGIPAQRGIYNFTVGVTGSYVEQNLSIEILSESGQQQICSDGTAYGQCSTTKPKFCSNGTLVENSSCLLFDNYTISYWKLDEGAGNIAGDSKGSNDGVITGAKWENVNCMSGKCLSFDGIAGVGSADFIDMGDKDDFEKQEFTLSFWAKLDNTQLGTNRGGIAKGDVWGAGNSYAYTLDFGAGNSSNINTFYARASIWTTGYVNVNASASDKQWHMWTMSVGKGNLSLYKDGILKARTSYSGTIGYSKLQNDFVIGSRKNGYIPFEGLIDEVMFFGKALNENEIQALYNSFGGPATCSDRIQNQDETGIDCGGVCINGIETNCRDGIDNDHDCLTDLDDLGDCNCNLGEQRVCGVGVCSLVFETCIDYRWPGCNLFSNHNYEINEISCSDSMDNDCDRKTDCQETDCCSNPYCQNDSHCIMLNNAISYWKLDEGAGNIAGDSKGSNDGVITGAKWENVNCMSGKCLSFDGIAGVGSADFIDMGDKDDFEKQEFTLSFWAKLDNQKIMTNPRGGIAKGDIFGTRDTGTYTIGFAYPMGQFADNISKFYAEASVIITSPTYSRPVVNTSAGDKEWHMWTMSVGKGNLSLYKDGILKARTSYSGTIGYSKLQNDFVIGSRKDGYFPFEGLIDEVMFFGKALNESEIRTLFGEIGTCSDGTAYGQCSTTKPKYCSNGTLIDNCAKCGCASGTCLDNGSCQGRMNNPPLLSPIGNKNVYENRTLTFMANATDPDGDELGYSVSGLPKESSFANRMFNWTPKPGQAGNYSVTFIVTDNGLPPLSDSESITITVLRCRGDANSDGTVNLPDLLLVVTNLRKQDYDSRADLNMDGRVNILDLIMVGRNFGRGC